MKSGKAVGPDDIPVEVWKCLGEAAVEFLTSLFNRVLESERMPEEWRRSVLVPIFKNKGDVQSCSNYRGIKLMSHTMKLWERVVEARLRKVVEICEQQYGFMPRKSTTDAIFALRILMEKYRDGQRELHCVFVDLEKAYDRVPREELWYCMRKSGVAEKYVRVVQDMYERSRTVVRCAVRQTEEFKVEVGLHQGSALSPFLFVMVMDQLSEERGPSQPTMSQEDEVATPAELPPEADEAASPAELPPEAHEAASPAELPPEADEAASPAELPPEAHEAASPAELPPEADEAASPAELPPEADEAASPAELPPEADEAASPAELPPEADEAASPAELPPEAHEAASPAELPPEADEAASPAELPPEADEAASPAELPPEADEAASPAELPPEADEAASPAELPPEADEAASPAELPPEADEAASPAELQYVCFSYPLDKANIMDNACLGILGVVWTLYLEGPDHQGGLHSESSLSTYPYLLHPQHLHPLASYPH
ncbi:hypothetical protein QTP86_034296 [Hemibagrus guttatus]|nr:hypothetical protein QTP86_034296 [Hemibagrus guttatus]